MMKRVLIACLLGAALPGYAQSGSTSMKLFLLVGQSNMAGRGAVEAQDHATHPRIFVLNQEMKWVPAKDPLHFDKAKMPGVGPGMAFARVIAEKDPKAVIGLIPCAMGGSSLDAWKAGGVLYNNAIARATEAQKSGKIAGILWHQGESDCGHDKIATYPQRFAAMMGQMRKDIREENVPVIIGEIGRFRPEHAAFNAEVPAIAKGIPVCDFVSSEGLEDKGDHLHFNSKAARALGRRYAEAFLKLQPMTGAPQAGN